MEISSLPLPRRDGCDIAFHFPAIDLLIPFIFWLAEKTTGHINAETYIRVFPRDNVRLVAAGEEYRRFCTARFHRLRRSVNILKLSRARTRVRRRRIFRVISAGAN